MRAIAIDNGDLSAKAIVKAAGYLRRTRMDKPMKEVVEYAREEARRELIDYLMREGK